MNEFVEDTVREVLAHRADEVQVPTGWEGRVLGAGRRRRRLRRTAITASVAAAVAVLGITTVRGVAEDLTMHFEFAGQPSMGPEVPKVEPASLPLGRATDLTYSAGAGDAPPGDVVDLQSGRWETGGFVMALEQAGEGVVARVSGADTEQLVYRGPGGHTVTLERGYIFGVAVSADGTRVAWSRTPGADADSGTGAPTVLKLATLPGGRVLASKSVPPGGINTFPGVAAFVGSKVLLDFDQERGRHPYAQAWDPTTGRIAPLLAPRFTGRGGIVVSVDDAGDTVLLEDSEDCLRSLSLAEPAKPDRWRVCDGQLEGGALSRDGRLVTGLTRNADAGWDAVWVRDARTGRLLATRVFPGTGPSAVVWESPDWVLVSYQPLSDKRSDRAANYYGEQLIRCSTDLRRCERVPVPGRLGVSALLSGQGTDLPLSGRSGN